MKRSYLILAFIAIIAISLSFALNSCKKEKIDTTIAIDQSSTSKLNIGETVTATITIVSEQVSAFNYYKVVDEVKGNPVDVKANLTQNGKIYTYDFSYVIQKFDDLHTLGFEFEVTDNSMVKKTTALVVNMNISVNSMFVKYDWKVTASTHAVWGNVLAPHDAAYIYRFHEDGAYDIDMTAQYAASTHHFCYWVYKETPSNGDTLAILRLIRKLKSGDAGVDEYYDYRITAANESTMTMYWDVAVFGLFNIKNIFTSQSKGAFQPYGTAAMAAAVSKIAVLNCSSVAPGLLIIP